MSNARTLQVTFLFRPPNGEHCLWSFLCTIFRHYYLQIVKWNANSFTFVRKPHRLYLIIYLYVHFALCTRLKEKSDGNTPSNVLVAVYGCQCCVAFCCVDKPVEWVGQAIIEGGTAPPVLTIAFVPFSSSQVAVLSAITPKRPNKIHGLII